jgi:hypothetical protein
LVTIVGFTELLRSQGPTGCDWDDHLLQVSKAARALSFLMFGTGPTNPRGDLDHKAPYGGRQANWIINGHRPGLGGDDFPAFGRPVRSHRLSG